MYFTHEKLDVYQSAIRFLSMVHEYVGKQSKTQRTLIDQLLRASLSIVLNIAEGAGEFSAPEKKRFYRIALRSCNECAAALHAATILRVIDRDICSSMRAELGRTVAMLIRLAGK
jgi:four helix bundle protein